MRLSRSFLTAASLIAITSATFAASKEEADKIKANLEKYLTTTPGLITVAVAGDAYDLTIDPSSLINNVNKAYQATSGIDVKLSPLKYKLSSQGSGKWQVDQDQPFAFTFKGGAAGEIEYKAQNLKINGVFDEAMSGFSTYTYSISNLETSQTVPATKQTTRSKIDNISGGSESTLNASGGVDFSGTYKTGKTSTDMKLDSGAMPFSLVYSANGADMSYSGVNLRQRELTALIAWFVARPAPDAIKKDQNDLRALLKSSLPVFDSMKAEGKAGKIDVETSFGNGAMKGADFTIDMAGLTKDGRFRESFAVNGITIADAIIPAQFSYAKKLIPTDFSLDFNVSGFDAAATSALVIDNFDLNKEPPLSKEIELQILGKALPNNQLKFSLAESHIKSSIYDLSYQADYVFDVTGKLPSGTATIKFTGFDKTLKVLQDAAQSDPSVNQAIGPLLAAKGFAKQEGETLVWATEITPTGGVLINGIDVTKMGSP